MGWIFIAGQVTYSGIGAACFGISTTCSGIGDVFQNITIYPLVALLLYYKQLEYFYNIICVPCNIYNQTCVEPEI